MSDTHFVVNQAARVEILASIQFTSIDRIIRFDFSLTSYLVVNRASGVTIPFFQIALRVDGNFFIIVRRLT